MHRPTKRTWLAVAATLLTASCGGSSGGGGSSPSAIAPTPPPAGFVGPTATSMSAATATAENNALCGAPVTPYYWELGDESGPLASGSVGSAATGPVSATSILSIASASKWLYSTYATQIRGSASALTTDDVNFLHFTSGYTNMGDSTTGDTCPNTLDPDTISQCLTLSNPEGMPFSAKDAATAGIFDYDSGHMENHAKLATPLANVPVASLGATIQAQLGTGVEISYTEPLMSGGASTTAAMYALVLRHILDGSLAMHDALGASPVCTLKSATCDAGFTPFPEEAWHYSIGHWVEDNPSTHGDGAFSSAGAFGFYPWIDATKTYYGIIARAQANGAYASAQCGRLIRRAWMTGVEQTETIPTD